MKLKRWIKPVVAILLFVILFQFVDWRQAVSKLSDASIGYSFAALFLATLGLILSALRWRVLLTAHELQVSPVDAIRVYWIGMFFSNFLPSNVGGDVVRASITRPEGKLAQVAASIVVERVTGVVVLLLLAIVALTLRPQYFEVAGLLPIIWITIGSMAAAVGAVVLFGERLAALLAAIRDRSRSGLVTRVLGKVGKLIDAVNDYKRTPAIVVSALVLALPFYVSVVVFQYSLVTAVGSTLPITEVLFVAPLIPLVSLIPVSLNALGIAEGAFVLFYTQAGLSPEEALAAALLRRVVVLVVSGVGGVFWITSKKEAVPKAQELEQ
jgi:uncharacterized protein (TIRG00374 family)